MEKTPKVKKLKKEGGGLKASSLIFAGISLVLTVLIFVGLLFLQNYLSKEIVYQPVVVAREDIPEDAIITADNAATYLMVKQINALDIPNMAITKMEDVLDRKAKVVLLSGEILTTKDFEDLSVYTADFENPVEISVDISNVANADGGKIRGGDLVNITMMFTREQLLGKTGSTTYSSSTRSTSLFSGFDEVRQPGGVFSFDFDGDGDNDVVSPEYNEAEPAESTQTATQTESNTSILVSGNSGSKAIVTKYNFDTYAQYVMESVYVTRVLGSDGVEIDPSNKDANAAIVIFTIEKADEPDINNALMNCANLRVSKVLNKQKAFNESKGLEENITESAESVESAGSSVETKSEAQVAEEPVAEEPAETTESTEETAVESTGAAVE